MRITKKKWGGDDVKVKKDVCVCGGGGSCNKTHKKNVCAGDEYKYIYFAKSAS